MYTRSSDFEERKLKMKKERQNADQEALFEAILTLRSPEECYAFFKDLCTYQELNAMAQRLQVAKMLHSGHVFHEIVEETGASTATISRVNRAIKDGCDGYQIIFDRTESPEPPKDERIFPLAVAAFPAVIIGQHYTKPANGLCAVSPQKSTRKM